MHLRSACNRRTTNAPDDDDDDDDDDDNNDCRRAYRREHDACFGDVEGRGQSGRHSAGNSATQRRLPRKHCRLLPQRPLQLFRTHRKRTQHRRLPVATGDNQQQR